MPPAESKYLAVIPSILDPLAGSKVEIGAITGNLVTKHPVEKIVRAPKDYDPDLGA